MKKSPQLPPNPASAVLRETFAPADKAGRLQGQHFVFKSPSPSSPEIMKPAPTPSREIPVKDKRKQAEPWEDSSGEGAASALESLRKLEQNRKKSKPAEDRLKPE
jgi:hypothetical protein